MVFPIWTIVILNASRDQRDILVSVGYTCSAQINKAAYRHAFQDNVRQTEVAVSEYQIFSGGSLIDDFFEKLFGANSTIPFVKIDLVNQPKLNSLSCALDLEVRALIKWAYRNSQVMNHVKRGGDSLYYL
jgi:hypothetical protein